MKHKIQYNEKANKYQIVADIDGVWVPVSRLPTIQFQESFSEAVAKLCEFERAELVREHLFDADNWTDLPTDLLPDPIIKELENAPDKERQEDQKSDD